VRPSVVLVLLALTLGSEARPQVPERRCPAPFADLLSPRVFDEYAVKVPRVEVRAVAPDVGSGQAHLYRTAIRDAAKAGPNFAGHYTIIRIGCGSATVCVAIADARTGKIYFPPDLENATVLLVDTLTSEVDTLNYRRNSRLLIVVGLPNENPKRAGIGYYVWRSGKLNLLRFTPAAKLCSLPPSTHF